MKRIDTGSSIIARYEDVLDERACATLVQFIVSMTGQNKAYDGMPWDNHDDVPYDKIIDPAIRSKIDSYRFLCAQLVYQVYQKIVFPHYTDLVVWRPGKSMPLHKDDGQEGYDEEFLFMRKYSLVLYLNDDYVGGDTIIRKADDRYYVSTPKRGSAVIFKSNGECWHGVSEIKAGTRYTLAMWFTDNIEHHEVSNVMDSRYPDSRRLHREAGQEPR